MPKDKSTITTITRPKSFGLLTAVTFCLPFIMVTPAMAGPGTDYFATTTKPSTQGKSPPNKHSVPRPPETLGSLAMMSRGSPVVTWFETFDDAIHSFRPSQADRVILNRPFNREKERVEQWIKVARKIANNYRACSQTLKGMSFPKDAAEGLKEYRDLTADWYLDVATIYEDLIKPRPAAKTMEELEDALNEIKGRAQSLTKTSSSLKAMDVSLRKQYNVHLARHDDALQQYVRGK